MDGAYIASRLLHRRGIPPAIDGASVHVIEVFGVKHNVFGLASHTTLLERVICDVELHIAVLGVVVGSLR